MRRRGRCRQKSRFPYKKRLLPPPYRLVDPKFRILLAPNAEFSMPFAICASHIAKDGRGARLGGGDTATFSNFEVVPPVQPECHANTRLCRWQHLCLGRQSGVALGATLLIARSGAVARAEATI
jgi:hypothetical protein